MEKFVPKSASGAAVRYMAVSAHKDDVEMLALDGIFKAYREGGGFAAAVLTDGGQCPRSKEYAAVGDEDMALLRTAEQKRAAEAGRYEALWLFERTSAEVKRTLEAVYLHNPFDRHPTHVAACEVALAAINRLDERHKPLKVYGCEVWRDLDWPADADKIALDVSGSDDLAAWLMACFVSQNAVKRYDIASMARRAANATFYQSHEGDEATALIYALDLTPLTKGQSMEDFAAEKLENFRRELHI